MRRILTRASALILVLLPVIAAVMMTGTAAAQSGDGLITGAVTNSQGQPLADINVTAAPVGNDTSLTQATTDANGDYGLTLPPGSYDVGFNYLTPTNDIYGPLVYGGPGPSATDICIICGGSPVTVTAGVITSGISAVLPTAPIPATGTVRPLSGDTIKVLDNRISFRFGCHENGIGCVGTGELKIGTSTKDPVVSHVSFEIAPNHSATLELTVPSAIRARLKAAKHHSLAAIVQLITPSSSTVTKFTLVDRP